MSLGGLTFIGCNSYRSDCATSGAHIRNHSDLCCGGIVFNRYLGRTGWGGEDLLITV